MSLYKYLKFITAFLFIITISNSIYAQRQKVQNRPYADQRLYSFGFTVGIHAQDLILMHSGFVQENGEVWFAEIPSYTPGFNVGIIADRYLNEYFNIRTVPSLYFGDKSFTFREQSTGELYKMNLKTNYFSVPLHVKYSAKRVNNFRPYMLAGVYSNMEIGSKKGLALKLNSMDFGIDIGFGCNFYMPLFKLCPEIRFSFGLVDLIDKKRTDLTDRSLMKYTEAISSGKSRMITFTFNFE